MNTAGQSVTSQNASLRLDRPLSLLQRFAYATKEEEGPASTRSAKIQAASAADESYRHAGQVPRVVLGRAHDGRREHYVLFKQTACHLPREANVEQIFSRAGLLADPNLNPAHLAVLVRIGFNKKAFEPAVAAIKEKYYELFRGKGGEHKEGSSGAAGAASSSAAGVAGAASSSDAADVAS